MIKKEVSLEAARTYLAELDLNYIITAMCAPSYPLPRWIEAEARHCASLYKNFLWLQKKYAPVFLVPTRHIDEFWHNHILYTRNYLHDCLHIFGHYLHHEPASPNDDPKVLIDAYLQTKQYYVREFGVELEAVIDLAAKAP